MQKMLTKAAHVIAAAGALNVGLFYFFHYDVVAHVTVLFGTHHMATVLYGLIGLAGLYSLISCFIPCEC